MKMLKSEYIILKNIDSKYKWIARDKDGCLNVYETKPTKSIRAGYWESDTYKPINLFPSLFASISWEDKEPYNINNLINSKTFEGKNGQRDSEKER